MRATDQQVSGDAGLDDAVDREGGGDGQAGEDREVAGAFGRSSGRAPTRGAADCRPPAGSYESTSSRSSPHRTVTLGTAGRLEVQQQGPLGHLARARAGGHPLHDAASSLLVAKLGPSMCTRYTGSPFSRRRRSTRASPRSMMGDTTTKARPRANRSWER